MFTWQYVILFKQKQRKEMKGGEGIGKNSNFPMFQLVSQPHVPLRPHIH